MKPVTGIDHVAITVADLESSCSFYQVLFDAQVVAEHSVNGRAAIRQICFGTVVFSIHQEGNGVDLVARRPTVGAADICLRWGGTVDQAIALLGQHGIDVVEGPVARRTANGMPSQSVYFRDPDGNLLELMTTN
jgi:catechol 2,3-dioxygenase-like lactoylglutathione lyase family enzyme